MTDEAYDRLEALGESRADAGEPDVFDDEYWKGIDVNQFVADIYRLDEMNEVADNLYIGGSNGSKLPTKIKHVVSLVPASGYAPHTQIDTALTIEMHDDRDQSLAQVDAIASWVNVCRKTGPVLVHCAAGLNRSGVVTARALMLDGMTADEAITRLRLLRSKSVLCNHYFEEWLRCQN